MDCTVSSSGTHDRHEGCHDRHWGTLGTLGTLETLGAGGTLCCLAQVLKIHTKDAFPKLLSYLGISVSAGIPEMKLDGISVVAVASNFSNFQDLPTLAAVTGLPADATPGITLSADISWTGCKEKFCKAVGKLFGTDKLNGQPGACV